MDAVQAADSGHPGTPMALAPAAYALYNEVLRYDPAEPDWPNRDRFVLSCGHASMLLYATLHLCGVKQADAAGRGTGAPGIPGRPAVSFLTRSRASWSTSSRSASRRKAISHEPRKLRDSKRRLLGWPHPSERRASPHGLLSSIVTPAKASIVLDAHAYSVCAGGEFLDV